MLRYFSVKNFKNFRDELVFDFTKTRDYKFSENCVKDGLVNKAIIYGKNATGKTNLWDAFGDLYFTTLSRFPSNLDIQYRNSDSDENETIQFYYSFIIDDTVIDYRYEKSSYTTVVSENLRFDEKVIFDYDRIKSYYNFDNVGIIGGEKLKWDEFQNMGNGEEDDEAKLLGSLTALRFIYSNTTSTEDSVFNKLIRFILRMRFSAPVSSGFIKTSLRIKLNEMINYNEKEIKHFQDFLNRFGISCKLIVLQEADGKNRIYFDHKTPLDFISNMSSGTLLLTLFYLQFMIGKQPPSIVFIDEFDAYYHYELSERIVRLLEEEFDCQVILTTHNTNLLSNSIMRPDCFFILHDGKLTPICDATPRELRQGHNLEKLYMSGEFDAEP